MQGMLAARVRFGPAIHTERAARQHLGSVAAKRKASTGTGEWGNNPWFTKTDWDYRKLSPDGRLTPEHLKHNVGHPCRTWGHRVTGVPTGRGA